MNMVLEAFATGAGILWKALWALIFGYFISASIQVLVTRKQMSEVLGRPGLKQGALAGFFGFVSSSCSFAALAAARSIWVKGAHPRNSLAFLIASTNLVVELGIVLWILLGWQFVLGNFLLGLLMIVIMYAMTHVWFPHRLADRARARADERQNSERTMQHDPGESLGGDWKVKLRSAAGWQAISDAFFMEWKMAYKEILFGFTIAGFIAVFVPDQAWATLFVQPNGSDAGFLIVLQHAALAPIAAFFTFIGSMGNVPLAALLWSKDVAFGGVMAFLGADLVAATVLYVQAKYYGFRYTAVTAGLLYVSMVVAGLIVHALFVAFDILPTARPELRAQVRFALDYTFWLNLGFGSLGALLLWLHVRRSKPVALRSWQSAR